MSDKYARLTVKTAIGLAAPHTWPPASIFPAVFGLALSIKDGFIPTWETALLPLAICILMQSGVNTLNDYYDFVKGVDTAGDHVEADDEVLVYHNVNPRHALLLGLGFLGLAALLGLRIVVLSGLAPLAAGLIGGAAVVFYSWGPKPISYLPIGELVSGGVMGGIIPLGVYASVSGQLRSAVFLTAMPFVIGVGLIMLTNNGSDIEKDIAAGRHTLPVKLGRKRTVAMYRSALAVWLVFAMVLAFWQCRLWALLLPGVLVCCRHALTSAFRTELLPEKRVYQMKATLKINILINGAYTAALLLSAVL